MRYFALVPLAAHGLAAWSIPSSPNHGLPQGVIRNAIGTSTTPKNLDELFNNLKGSFDRRLDELLESVQKKENGAPASEPVEKEKDEREGEGNGWTYFNGAAWLEHRIDLQDDNDHDQDGGDHGHGKHDHDHDHDGHHGHDGDHNHGKHGHHDHDHDHTNPHNPHHGSGDWGGGSPDDNDPYDGTDPFVSLPFLSHSLKVTNH